MCTALFCYCWRRTTCGRPRTTVAATALNFGVIVVVAGELSCEEERIGAARWHADDGDDGDSSAGRKKKCRRPSFHRRAGAADDAADATDRTTAAVSQSVRLRTLAP